MVASRLKERYGALQSSLLGAGEEVVQGSGDRSDVQFVEMY